MKRYYNKEEYDDNDDDENEEKNSFYESESGDEDEDEYEDDIEVSSDINQKGIIDIMQIDMAQNELNQSLLEIAIKIAKQSWFWTFKSHLTKMEEIEEIYNKLTEITDK